jgi:hypothetical protein
MKKKACDSVAALHVDGLEAGDAGGDASGSDVTDRRAGSPHVPAVTPASHKWLPAGVNIR